METYVVGKQKSENFSFNNKCLINLWNSKKHYSLILFLCLFCVQVFAQSGTEKINVNFKNIPLKEALPMIEKGSSGMALLVRCHCCGFKSES